MLFLILYSSSRNVSSRNFLFSSARNVSSRNFFFSSVSSFSILFFVAIFEENAHFISKTLDVEFVSIQGV